MGGIVELSFVGLDMNDEKNRREHLSLLKKSGELKNPEELLEKLKEADASEKKMVDELLTAMQGDYGVGCGRWVKSVFSTEIEMPK